MTEQETRDFLSDFRLEVGDSNDVDIVIAPPFTAIPAAAQALADVQNIKLAAQNMHAAPNGAFTGEISAIMLREFYVRYVILGHSERRTLFHEDNTTINRKVLAALEAKLRPILCVGETLAERDAGQLDAVLKTQLTEGLVAFPENKFDELVLAYEPVWAIGTGRNATPEQAQDAHAKIREILTTIAGDAAAKIRIQYGGSVKPANATELLAQPDIDGALVGGASLEPRSFSEIIKAARS